jgi:lysophospholipase L1-like esterase
MVLLFPRAAKQRRKTNGYAAPAPRGTALLRTTLAAASVCAGALACAPADGGEAPDGVGAVSGAGASAAGNGAGGAGAAAVGGAGAGAGGAGGAGASTQGGSLTGGAGAAAGAGGSPTSGGGGGGAGGTANGGGGAGGAANGGGGTGGSGMVPAVPLDPALMARCTGTSPIKCTIPVAANGNYHVTVELGSPQAASHSRVQAELYRIVTPVVTLAAGAYSQQTFSVNVRAEDHDGYDAPGKELNVLIDGDAPALHGLGYAAATMPTLFVVGDSTVCDWDPAAANLGPQERGWAQEFSLFLKPGLSVANYADSGDTAGSLYGKFASRGAVLKEGDYLFIQFGHNDQKSQSGIDNYKANLTKFITDARNAKATPVLFSPVARKTATLADPGFAGLDQQARELAQSEKVAFVDLTTLAINYYATVDKSSLFASTTEVTHFNVAGATAVSKLVADALRAGTTPDTSIQRFLR